MIADFPELAVKIITKMNKQNEKRFSLAQSSLGDANSAGDSPGKVRPWLLVGTEPLRHCREEVVSAHPG